MLAQIGKTVEFPVVFFEFRSDLLTFEGSVELFVVIIARTGRGVLKFTVIYW